MHRSCLTRHSIAAVIVACACGLVPSVPAADGPLLAVPGEVVYENSLAEKPAAPWRAAKGRWEAVEGALRGSELPEDKHGAVLRLIGPVPDNVVIEYEFRFTEGAKSTTLSINDAKDHVCRLLMTPRTFTVQKDDNDHEGPDKPVVFSRQMANLAPGQWHKVRLEIIGNTMLGQCDGHVGHGSHELIGKKKVNFGFTVSGQSVDFRNLKISQATPNPQWEKIKGDLPAGEPAPAPSPKGKGKGKKKAE
jgi:hypothetical protein